MTIAHIKQQPSFAGFYLRRNNQIEFNTNQPSIQHCIWIKFQSVLRFLQSVLSQCRTNATVDCDHYWKIYFPWKQTDWNLIPSTQQCIWIKFRSVLTNSKTVPSQRRTNTSVDLSQPTHNPVSCIKFLYPIQPHTPLIQAHPIPIKSYNAVPPKKPNFPSLFFPLL